MNLMIFVLAFLASGFQFSVDEQDNEDSPNGKICITAEKITKPIHGWNVLKTEILYNGKNPYVEITAHNPLNSNSSSVDARFVLSIDPAVPSDPQKYNLETAIYYNDKVNVIFKRIYEPHKIIVNGKVQNFPIQTPCFSRQIIQILNFTPEEVNVPNSNGGTK